MHILIAVDIFAEKAVSLVEVPKDNILLLIHLMTDSVRFVMLVASIVQVRRIFAIDVKTTTT